jgi:2-amino-4-hydroxy-6-hydroxymethyldihydropteridine diphosphokinase
MRTAFIGIGSNLGNREENLSIAVTRIGETAGNILSASSVYETEPWGFQSDNKFLNMVLTIDSHLVPQALLKTLLKIEESMGRLRKSADYSSRIIDLDILFYDSLIIKEDSLIIPHPHIQDRKFVLVPMAEIAPDFIHPVLKKSVTSLLDLCADTGVVKKRISRLSDNQSVK